MEKRDEGGSNKAIFLAVCMAKSQLAEHAASSEQFRAGEMWAGPSSSLDAVSTRVEGERTNWRNCGYE